MSTFEPIPHSIKHPTVPKSGKGKAKALENDQITTKCKDPPKNSHDNATDVPSSAHTQPKAFKAIEPARENVDHPAERSRRKGKARAREDGRATAERKGISNSNHHDTTGVSSSGYKHFGAVTTVEPAPEPVHHSAGLFRGKGKARACEDDQDIASNVPAHALRQILPPKCSDEAKPDSSQALPNSDDTGKLNGKDASTKEHENSAETGVTHSPVKMLHREQSDAALPAHSQASPLTSDAIKETGEKTVGKVCEQAQQKIRPVNAPTLAQSPFQQRSEAEHCNDAHDVPAPVKSTKPNNKVMEGKESQSTQYTSRSAVSEPKSQPGPRQRVKPRVRNVKTEQHKANEAAETLLELLRSEHGVKAHEQSGIAQVVPTIRVWSPDPGAFWRRRSAGVGWKMQDFNVRKRRREHHLAGIPKYAVNWDRSGEKYYTPMQVQADVERKEQDDRWLAALGLIGLCEEAVVRVNDEGYADAIVNEKTPDIYRRFRQAYWSDDEERFRRRSFSTASSDTDIDHDFGDTSTRASTPDQESEKATSGDMNISPVLGTFAATVSAPDVWADCTPSVTLPTITEPRIMAPVSKMHHRPLPSTASASWADLVEEEMEVKAGPVTPIRPVTPATLTHDNGGRDAWLSHLSRATWRRTSTFNRGQEASITAPRVHGLARPLIQVPPAVRLPSDLFKAVKPVDPPQALQQSSPPTQPQYWSQEWVNWQIFNVTEPSSRCSGCASRVKK